MPRARKIAELLEAHEFTRGLGDQALQLIAGCGRNFRFNAGQYIMREGEDADRFYLIRHGTVALEMFIPGRGPHHDPHAEGQRHPRRFLAHPAVPLELRCPRGHPYPRDRLRCRLPARQV